MLDKNDKFQAKQTKVLIATAQNNMLGRLQEANELLDEIQRGLNAYLEKKRIFFPRYDVLLMLIFSNVKRFNGLHQKNKF